METELSNTVFPLEKNQWDHMINKVKEILPDDRGELIDKICSTKMTDDDQEDEGEISTVVKEPIFPHTSSVIEKVDMVQNYLNKLQYNHTGTQFFEIKMNRSITRLFDVAKDIIKYSLPIKCLEAVIVALYLTANITSLNRFTIRFKSQFSKKTHRHIVLGVYHNSNYGAVGLSRRNNLMYKPCSFKSLSDLIHDFTKCYSECCHRLKKVKLSPPISSDIYSCDQIHWDYFVLPVGKMNEIDTKSLLEKYSRELRTKNTY